MDFHKEFKVTSSNSPFGFFVPLIILTVFFSILFFLAWGIYKLFFYITPVLLIVSLILDYKVILGYFKFIWKLLREKPIWGLIAILLTFFGHPFVSIYLAAKALASKRISKLVDKAEAEQNTFTEFEEVVDTDTTFLELPPLQTQKREANRSQSTSNEYDDMFK